MNAFVTLQTVIALTADEMKKASTAMVAKVSSRTDENTIADLIQVRYTAEKKRIKSLNFHLVEDSLFDDVEHACLDTCFVRKGDKLAE